EVDAAALPGAAEHLVDRLLQPGMRVGDDELHPGQAALDQATEEAAPERFRLGLADIEADHLAIAGLVDAVGEHERLAHDTATVANLLDLGIEPQIGVAALERPVAKRVDLLIKALTDPRD